MDRVVEVRVRVVMVRVRVVVVRVRVTHLSLFAAERLHCNELKTPASNGDTQGYSLRQHLKVPWHANLWMLIYRGIISLRHSTSLPALSACHWQKEPQATRAAIMSCCVVGCTNPFNQSLQAVSEPE